MSPRILIASPDGRQGTMPQRLAPSPAVLSGRRVGVLDNGKPNARLLLTALAGHLVERAGAVAGPVLGKGSAATPCEGEVLEKLRLSADVVLTGSGD